MVAFKDFMDKATFTWQDEPPKANARGPQSRVKKYGSLIAALESNPERVMRLTQFFDMSMAHLKTNVVKYLTDYEPKKKEYIRLSSRKEMEEGKIVFVLYLWIDMEQI